MDYKKKYKNALPYIKDLIEHNVISTESAGKYFPELKESEDEKIRESIIENLKGNMCRTDGDYDLLNKQIAWLEKQGEQKQDPCEHCVDKRLNCHNFSCIKKRAFKQGKSVFEAIIDEKVDNANKVETKFKDGDVLNSPSHHLIWIYKDNEHYYACVNMNYVTENVATDGLINIPSDVRPATKEQREQLEKEMTDAGYRWSQDKKKMEKIEQKPAWSEEDMSKIQRICKYLDEAKKYYADITEVRECIDWLKSLRPQNTWKPSDEQIKAVRLARSFVTDDFGENHTLSDVLVELEKQLKKLK